MAISEAQREFRAARLGSSDALRLMAGSWRAVWEEKTGRTAPATLDHVVAVQIGIATEPLHARFFTYSTGIPCRPAEGTLVHPVFDFIVAHLDFLTWQRAEDAAQLPCDTLLEAKFSTGFKSDSELAEHYYWQIQHQLLVSGLAHARLSILRSSAYSIVAIARDDRDIAKLLDTLHAFWWYVDHDVEPADVEAMPPPAPAGTRVFDMSRHNEFAAWAGMLIEHRAGMCVYREAEAAVKGLMPPDAQIAFYPPAAAVTDDAHSTLAPAHDGLFLLRSSDGKLSLRFGEIPQRHRRRAEMWRPIPRE